MRNVAAALGVKAGMLPRMIEAQEPGFYEDGGFKIWDISDKSNPKQLCHVRTHGFGTHRFDMDESYAYISTEMEGLLSATSWSSTILPTRAARRKFPAGTCRGQHLAGGETPTWTRYSHRLHHGLRVGDEIWALGVAGGISRGRCFGYHGRRSRLRNIPITRWFANRRIRFSRSLN